MAVSDYAPHQEATTHAPINKGEHYEKVAFNFCKAATIILLTGRFALPVAAGAATVFYLLAHFNGKTNSRCILQKPWLIATFWGMILVAWVALQVHPIALHLYEH